MNQIDPRLKDKTFVCGVGVQKAGTTWLHDYLADRGDIYMSTPKEIHFFDTLYAAERNADLEGRFLSQVIKRLKGSSPDDPPGKRRKLLTMLDMYRMYIDDDGYADYFARRVGDNMLFGEITPAYCLIGEEGFSHIRRLFPKIKIIYLMRDPIDRHYSMSRMAVKRNASGLTAEEYFRKSLDRPFGRGMGNYQYHLETLREMFKPDELFIGYYENLFNDAQIQRICDFLGVPFMTGDYGFHANKSEEGQGLTSDMVMLAREAFDGVYSYCKKTLPDVPKSWRFEV